MGNITITYRDVFCANVSRISFFFLQYTGVEPLLTTSNISKKCKSSAICRTSAEQSLRQLSDVCRYKFYRSGIRFLPVHHLPPHSRTIQNRENGANCLSPLASSSLDFYIRQDLLDLDTRLNEYLVWESLRDRATFFYAVEANVINLRYVDPFSFVTNLSYSNKAICHSASIGVSAILYYSLEMNIETFYLRCVNTIRI